jgi:AcrR family transcriptional regulator
MPQPATATAAPSPRPGQAQSGQAQSGQAQSGQARPAQPRTDTRARVQKVALELFAEQGYEKTSLREIAERLGVTKAALYYHFRSKEDIVHSFTDDHFSRIDELIEWARTQPPGSRTRREILDRYVSIVLAGAEVFRFIEQNRAAMESMESPKKERFTLLRTRLEALVELLAGPDAQLRTRARASAALFAASAACILVWDGTDDPGELHAIALEIATDLVS